LKKVRISRFVFLTVLSLLLISFSFALIFRNSSLVSAVSSPIRSFVFRIDYLVSAPFRAIDSMNEEVKNLFDTYAENKRLKKKVAELEDQSDLVSSLKEENEKLNSEVGMQSSVTSQISTIGRVIVRSPVSWYDALTVKLGNPGTVRKKMLVLSDGSLVGSVTDVRSDTASVSLLTNGSNFNIPIKIKTDSTEVYGLLEHYDLDKKCFVITDLNSSVDIKSGATVVTSGLDGDTVANVSVGTVSSEKSNSESLKRVIYVTPAADFSDISYVTIIGD